MEFSITQGSDVYPVVEARIIFPRKGLWTIEARLDSDSPLNQLSGSIFFEGAGMQLTGSCIGERTGWFMQKNTAYIVAGAGKMLTPVSGQDYSQATVQILLSDICDASGETLSTDSDSNITNSQLDRWTRSTDVAQNQINDIVKQIGNNAVWRFGTDGKLLVTTESWPSVTIDNVQVLNEFFSEIKREFWIETVDLSTIRPGVVWNNRRISAVEISIQSERTRVITWFESENTFNPLTTGNGVRFTNQGRLADGFINLINSIMKRNQYNALFPCEVIASDLDNKTVDVQPDSSLIPGLSAIPIKCLSTGIIAIPSSGSRGILSFEGNDPSHPVFLCSTWNAGSTDNGKTKAMVINIGEETTALNDTDFRVNAEGVICLGDPDNAQFNVMGSDLKDYIDNKIKSAINDARTDLQSVGTHTHLGTAGPYPLAENPSVSLSSLPTQQQLQNSPDLSAKVKNS